METIFKEGMRVYDQLNFPDIEGEVSDVNSKEYKGFPIKVWFSDTCTYYTEDGREELDTIPSLSTKPYIVELKGFEQKALVPTFEEVLINCDKRYPPNIRAEVDYKEIYPTKELSDAAEAIRRLLFLRDYYNEGWQPNWKKNDPKYIIENCEFKLVKDTVFSISKVMAFKSEKVRDIFLEEQRELLEIAKPLL